MSQDPRLIGTPYDGDPRLDAEYNNRYYPTDPRYAHERIEAEVAAQTALRTENNNSSNHVQAKPPVKIGLLDRIRSRKKAKVNTNHPEDEADKTI